MLPLARGPCLAFHSARRELGQGLERAEERLAVAGRQPGEDLLLPLSQTTVKSHVNHVFAKIGVRARAQAVTYAYRHGLT